MTETMQSHYGREGIVERIVQDLAESGVDTRRVSVDDLDGIDEFHVGGRAASERIAPLLGLGDGQRLLDVGCGIGGPARYFAEATGAHVEGIDLTPEFVAAANELTELVGLGDRVTCRLGSGTEIPFADDAFDASTLMHVGMNIEDKSTLLREMARVTRTGGVVLLYDLMRTGPGELAYPMPWASTATFSFVDPPDLYEEAARAAGLEPVDRLDFSDLARGFFDPPNEGEQTPAQRDRAANPRRKSMFANAADAIRSGSIKPIVLVFTVA